MSEVFFSTLLVFDQILSAGNSITAFSLLLYALTFNLRERVARTFALVLACLTLVYFGDVLSGLVTEDVDLGLWLRLQWVGISFLPTTVLHLSDAILSSTGRPSRGRRQWLIRTQLPGQRRRADPGRHHVVAGRERPADRPRRIPGTRAALPAVSALLRRRAGDHGLQLPPRLPALPDG